MQDIGAQSIVPLLRLAAGQWLLDLCAAPGNKTAQALESGAHVVAGELHVHRAQSLKAVTANVVVLDGTRALPFNRTFADVRLSEPVGYIDAAGLFALALNGKSASAKYDLRPGDPVALRLEG